MSALPAPGRWRGLFALLIIFAVSGAIFSVVNPIFEAPDEIQHFFYVKQLADGGGLPHQGLADPPLPWDQEGSQPPLYYGLAALLVSPVDTSDALSLLWENPHANIGNPLRPGNKNRIVHTEQEAWPYHDTTLAVHIARWLSLALGLITVALTYAIVQTLMPGAHLLGLAVAATVAFTPQFLFIHSSVTNDALITTLAAFTAWIIARLYRDGPDAFPGWPLLLGLALGLSALAKLSGLLVWLWAGAACLVLLLRRAGWRRAARDLALAFAIALAISGWWYLRNWQLYGDPTGLNAMLEQVGRQAQPLGWRGVVSQFQGLRISYWALFGWFNLPLPDPVYRLLDLFVLVALAGLGLAILQRIARGRPAERSAGDWGALLLAASWIALLLFGLIGWVTTTPGAQGRLLFPGAWAIALILMAGWSRWPVVGRRGVWLALPPIFLALLAALSPWLVIRPAFQRPPIMLPAEVPPEVRLEPVYHGAPVRSVGGLISPDTAHPGDTVRATNYWELLEPLSQDYTAFVHMLDQDNRSVAESNSWPGQGSYPTRLWQPGTVVADTHPVQVPQDVDAPALLRADFGLFLAPQGEELRSQTAEGTPVENIIGTLRILPAHPAPARPQATRHAEFADHIRLLGYDLLGVYPAQAGRPATITLHWQADARPAEDYTVFVHLRDAAGANIAQSDSIPRAGAWPTSAWEPAQPVPDRHTLTIPQDAPPGVYSLWAGMYHQPDETRLAVRGADTPVLDDAIFLQDVVIARD